MTTMKRDEVVAAVKGLKKTAMAGLDWRTERVLVENALTALLPTLNRPYLTMPLGFRLSQLTNLPEKRCRQVLGWLANDGHAHATKDGGIVTTYGRSVTRWRWHPTPQRGAKGMKIGLLEARLNELGVIDSTDW